jgi:hypothetical protein
MSKSKKTLISEIIEVKKQIKIEEKKKEKIEMEMLPTLSVKQLKEDLEYWEIELYSLKDDKKI